MTLIKTALRGGVAAVAIAGFSAIAAAQAPQTHVLTIALPGGGIEQIRYAGAVAPQVFVGDAPTMTLPAMFGANSPFADLERISAAMDRQTAQLFQEVAALSARPAQLGPAAIGALPAGAQEYQLISTMTGDGVCSRSVEITSQGNGAAPRVVTHTSGNCAAGPGLQVPAQLPTAPMVPNRPRMIMTKATGAQPPAGLVEEAALR